MITADTAAALEALALTIFNPNTDLAMGTVPGRATGLRSPDLSIDLQMYTLIAPVMLAIDGHAMPAGVRHSLNVTCALKARPKHWFLAGIMEYNTSNPGVSSLWPCNTALEFIPDSPYGVAGGTNSFGYSIGLATCACILHAWAAIVRMWLAGNYPMAVTQP